MKMIKKYQSHLFFSKSPGMTASVKKYQKLSVLVAYFFNQNWLFLAIAPCKNAKKVGK